MAPCGNESRLVAAGRALNASDAAVGHSDRRIEQSFRDDKSAGFDMDQTKLDDLARIERLLLAVAIAALW